MTSQGEVMAQLFKPGHFHLSYGLRGGGKTHTAVSICENLVEGRWPEVGKVVLLTNIVFITKKNGKLKREAPPNVYHINELKEIFPIIAEIMEKEGRNVTILLLLDEAQNFLLGDMNFEKLTQDIKMFSGIIRKFQLCMWCITPNERNLGPAFRNLANDPKDAGNVYVKWHKDSQRTAEYLKAHRIDLNPRDVVIEQDIFNDRPRFLQIPKGKWTSCTADPEKLKEGEYCYDTFSNANFTVGEDFDFSAFVKATSSVAYFEMVDTIKGFYAKQEEIAEIKENPADDAEIQRALRIHRMRDILNLPWKHVCYIEGNVKRTTLISSFNRSFPGEDDDKMIPPFLKKELEFDVETQNDENSSSTESAGASGNVDVETSSEGENGASTENSSASSVVDDEIKASSKVKSIYILEERENGQNQGVPSTGIPDGRYTEQEFRRAAEHCLPKEDPCGD